MKLKGENKKSSLIIMQVPNHFLQNSFIIINIINIITKYCDPRMELSAIELEDLSLLPPS